MPICDFCNVEVPAVKLKNHNTSWFHQRAVKIFEWNGIPCVSDNHCAFCDKGFSSPSKLSQHLITDKNHTLLVDVFQRSIQNQQHARAPSPPVRAPPTLSSDPKGVRNKGNTCFAAVAWQALKNVLPYTNLGWEIVQHLPVPTDALLHFRLEALSYLLSCRPGLTPLFAATRRWARVSAQKWPSGKRG